MDEARLRDAIAYLLSERGRQPIDDILDARLEAYCTETGTVVPFTIYRREEGV